MQRKWRNLCKGSFFVIIYTFRNNLHIIKHVNGFKKSWGVYWFSYFEIYTSVYFLGHVFLKNRPSRTSICYKAPNISNAIKFFQDPFTLWIRVDQSFYCALCQIMRIVIQSMVNIPRVTGEFLTNFIHICNEKRIKID